MAEARYHRGLHALHVSGVAFELAQEATSKIDMAMRAFDDHSDAVSGRTSPNFVTLAHKDVMVEQFEARAAETELKHEHRLNERYLGEARSGRRKALKAWCELNITANQNSRNELQAQSDGH